MNPACLFFIRVGFCFLLSALVLSNDKVTHSHERPCSYKYIRETIQHVVYKSTEMCKKCMFNSVTTSLQTYFQVWILIIASEYCEKTFIIILINALSIIFTIFTSDFTTGLPPHKIAFRPIVLIQK